MQMLSWYMLILYFNVFNTTLIDGECINNVWIHSYEEDEGNKSVYRPKSYEFPPSRGRDGFQIKQNGEIIFKTIGETDTPQLILGNFQIKDQNNLHIEFKNSSMSKVMTIISCEKDLLVIEKFK